MSFFMLASGVAAREPQGLVGDWAAHGDMDRWSTGWNAYPQAKQVTTVTLTDGGDDDDVIITINGVNVSLATGTGFSLAAIGALFAQAINAEPLVRGSVIATFDTATLTLTGIVPGEAFTVSIASDPDSWLSAVTAVVVADEADPIPVGRVVVSQGYDSGEPEERVALPLAALFTPQVATLAFGAFVTAQVNTIVVYEVRGNERIQIAYVSEAAATDRDTTVDTLIALLEAQFPANSVAATADAGTATAIVFTAEKPGLEFAIDYLAGHEGASLQSLTLTNTTGPSTSTSLARSLAGVSMGMSDEEAVDTAGDPVWPANAGVRVAREGKLFVANAETPAMNGVVWVETASGASTGKLYAASSATRLALPRALAAWERDGRDAAANLAVVRLNVP